MSLTTSALKGRDFEGSIQRFTEDPRLTPDQQQTLKAFVEELRQGELSLPAQRTYAFILRDLGIYLAKPYKQAKREDLRRFISQLETRNSESTLRAYKSNIKRFYKWLYDSEEPPKVVSWIKTWGRPRKGRQELKIKDYIITPEEYEKLLGNAKHPRDQALISLLWDTGGRAIEILATNIEEVDLTSPTPSIILAGKRKVPLIESLPYLTAWLNLNHSLKRAEKGPHPLWNSRYGDIFTYSGLAWMLVEVSRRAGIRNITSKMFRHTRATLHARRGLNPYVMNRAMGWTPGSKMWAIYHHLDGKDTIEGIREVYGLEQIERKIEPIVLESCPRCHQPLPKDATRCLVCALPLDAKEILETEANRETLIEALAERVARLEAWDPDTVRLMKAKDEIIRQLPSELIIDDPSPTPAYAVVEESELVDRLSQGWEILRELNGSHKILIRKKS